jgi:hypothetical protein
MSSTEQTGPTGGAISVFGYDELLQGCVEVARLWVKNKGPATFIINPNRLEKPEMFGMLMTDCVRHAARAYANRMNITEGEALSRIWEGLDAERDRHTTDLTTIKLGGSLN